MSCELIVRIAISASLFCVYKGLYKRVLTSGWTDTDRAIHAVEVAPTRMIHVRLRIQANVSTVRMNGQGWMNELRVSIWKGYYVHCAQDGFGRIIVSYGSDSKAVLFSTAGLAGTGLVFPQKCLSAEM